MSEQENLTNVEIQTESDKVLELIKDRDENYVHKSTYDKVVKDRDTYYKACTEAKPISSEVEESKPDMNQLRANLYDVNVTHSDIGYIANSLELRDQVLESTGVDIMYNPAYDVSIYDGLKEMVDSSDGNNDVFVARFHALKKK